MQDTKHSPVYSKINRRLPCICERISEVLSQQSKTDDTRMIIRSFVRGAQRTLLAVNALQNQELWEPAQVLARVLFESLLTFRQFARRYQEDPHKACQRIVDVNLLQTLKHFSLVTEAVNVAAQVESMHSNAQVIEQRYDQDEIKRMRKHGFTGLTVIERARQEGCAQMYDLVYRLFSRHVHGTALVETMSLDESSPLPDEEWALAHRNELTLYIAGTSAAGIVDLTNRICACGLDSQVSEISKLLESTEEAVRAKGGPAPHPPASHAE